MGLSEPAPKAEVDPREALVAPGRGKAGQPQQRSQPKVWNDVDIRKFYSDLRRGVYRGREAEADAIDADIIRANAEGRVR
jgi:NADPH-dependent glutamate synthase beta subunit-like oxidoreductase